MSKNLFVILFFLLSCGDSDEIDCSTLTETRCGATSECESIRAVPFDTANMCVDLSRRMFAGCVPKEDWCSYAASGTHFSLDGKDWYQNLDSLESSSCENSGSEQPNFCDG